MTTSDNRLRQFGMGFAVLSFLTVALGAFTLQQGGLSAGLWLRNPVAWLIGSLLCLGLTRVLRPSPWVLVPALLLLVLTFVAPGQEGVHRWLALGPIQINAAALILPFVLTAITPPDKPAVRAVYLVGMGLIVSALIRQPDLSQLIAFCGGAAVLFILHFKLRLMLIAAPVILIAIHLCSLQPDPLQPVAHVEGVFLLALSQSPLQAAGLAACLLLTALSPLWVAKDEALFGRAFALALYFFASSSAWLFGAFPVPLAGYGISFVLGWWLGVAGLFAKSRVKTI